MILLFEKMIVPEKIPNSFEDRQFNIVPIFHIE
jgi:hypothetical protein